MPTFYPPVLESKARAIPFISFPSDTDFFQIEFQMPSINVLTDINHIQVAIKYQATNESAVSKDYSPDRATIFIARSEGAKYFYRRDNGNYVIQLPYKCFDTGRPKQGTVYTVQVRFGANNLWDTNTNGIDHVKETFGAFAPWRNLSINTVPSSFGEWSNLQTVYCYGEATETLEYNLNDFVPEIVYRYAPVLDDPLEQCHITYQYADMYGERTGSMVFNGQYQQDGSYIMAAKIPIAPVQTLRVFVSAVTKNNTIRGKDITIFPLKMTKDIPNLKGKIEDAKLIGEENKDGALAKTITFASGSLDDTHKNFMNLYRSNVYTLETVKVLKNMPVDEGVGYTVKDYSVEMGEEYQYIATIVNEDNVIYGTAIDVYDWGYTNPGYGRLMDMDATVFLTTRKHQLRLQGAVNVTTLKRNTQDNFQTTLGSKYPFYSRNAQTNYRSFSLTGFISLAFDPTGTFLENDSDNGLWWEDDNGSKLVILNRDLYRNNQHSISRRRTHELARNDNNQITQLGTESQRDVFGPMTIYDDYFFRNSQVYNLEEKSSESIYMERKFREYVMEWLSNGKPKLFRSETEGNMIVMLSGVTFSPQERTARMTYSMSCTVTEIAEYNLENLEAYDLVPYDISSKIISGFPKRLQYGDLISEQDYLTIIYYFPEYDYLNPDSEEKPFSPNGTNYIVQATGPILDKINKLLSNITEFSHIRGNLDYWVYNSLAYEYNKIFDIPDSISGMPIKAIDTSLAIKNAPEWVVKKNPQLTLKGVPVFSVDDGQLPPGITLNPKTGIISGTPIHEGDKARDPDVITLKVTYQMYKQDDKGKFTIRVPEEDQSATMRINVGFIYTELKFEKIKTSIPITTVGEQITPINISQFVHGGVKYSDYESNTTINYLWRSEGLPAGLSISEMGYITGSYISSLTGGKATIIVTDAVGQTKKQDIDFGDGIQPIFFQDSIDFNLGYTEVGEAITTVDVSRGVSGGYPTDDRSEYIHGYRFEAKGLPSGIDINKYTGVISGTPTQAQSAGTATITAYDFGDPVMSSSIEIVYQTVLEQFLFRDSASFDIMPNGEDKGINIGTTIKPIELLPEGENVFQAVIGGLKYGQKPWYRFSAINLMPDFSIDNNGKITGRATVKSGPRTATLIVEDARGKTKTIDIRVCEIISELAYNPVGEQIKIPERYVGDPSPDFEVQIPFEWITGGTPGVVHTDGNTYPYGIEIQNLPRGYSWSLKRNEDDTCVIIITGKPTEGCSAGEATMTIKDNSPQKETVVVKIPFEAQIAKLTWNQDVVSIIGTQEGESIDKIYLASIDGGKPRYSMAIVDAQDFAPKSEFEPLLLHQPETGEDEKPNGRFYIDGKIAAHHKGKQFRILVSDESGQTIPGIVTIGDVAAAFEVKAVNTLLNTTLIKDQSVFNKYKVMVPSGGYPPYVLCMLDDNNTRPFQDGVILDKENGTLTGVISTMRDSQTNMKSVMYGYDHGGPSSNKKEAKQAFVKEDWHPPKVVEAPKLTDLASGGTFKVPILNVDQPYDSGVLIQSPAIPGLTWTVDKPESLPPGLKWSGGSLFGTVSGNSKKGKVVCSAEIPELRIDPAGDGSQGTIVTPKIKVSVTLDIDGVATPINITRPDNLNYDFFELNKPIEVKNVAANLSGGNPPYSWELINAEPGLSISPTKTNAIGEAVNLQGTPTQVKNGQIVMSIKVTDSIGQTSSYDFYSGGTFDAFTFDDNPALDIPPQKSNQDIIPIDVSKFVIGGSRQFNYQLENTTPYTIDRNGVISGNSGSVGYPERIGIITVTDSLNALIKKSVEITVGAITGQLNYQHKPEHDIPETANKPNSTGQINLATGVSGGTSLTYTITKLPEGWTATNASIPNPSQGIVNYKTPAAGTAAGVIEVEIADTATGDKVQATISTPAIVE